MNLLLGVTLRWTSIPSLHAKETALSSDSLGLYEDFAYSAFLLSGFHDVRDWLGIFKTDVLPKIINNSLKKSKVNR